MKIWKRAALLLACTMLLTAGTAAAEKEYHLVIGVTGPVTVTVSHAAADPDAEPVNDYSPGAADSANVIAVTAEAITLKEGPDYDVRLDGTGEGTLCYTVTLRDPEGKEEDLELHRFENIPVDENTVLKTVSSAKDQNTMIAYVKDGEELKAEAAYGSGKNSPQITVNTQTVILAGILLLILIAIPLLLHRRRVAVVLQKPILLRRG